MIRGGQRALAFSLVLSPWETKVEGHLLHLWYKSHICGPHLLFCQTGILVLFPFPTQTHLGHVPCASPARMGHRNVPDTVAALRLSGEGRGDREHSSRQTGPTGWHNKVGLPPQQQLCPRTRLPVPGLACRPPGFPPPPLLPRAALPPPAPAAPSPLSGDRSSCSLGSLPAPPSTPSMCALPLEQHFQRGSHM